MQDKIRIDFEGQTVITTPKGFLGRERFQNYLGACKQAGLRYHAETKTQRGPVSTVNDLITALRQANFGVETSADLLTLLQASVEQAKPDPAIEPRLAALAARGMTPYPFQREGVAWLSQRLAQGRSAALTDEMGLGKTVQALLALAAGTPVLVICPASLKGNWKSEANRWRPDFSCQILSGRGSMRWPVGGEMVITNYDCLSEIIAAPAPGTVVITDEAHALKNRNAKRSQLCSKLFKAVRDHKGQVVVLTGTPLLNTPPELWQVLDVAGLADEAFGSFGRFYGLFNAQRDAYGTTWGHPKPEVPNLLRRVSLHRRRADVLPDLPTKTYRTIEVNGLSRDVVAACDAFVARLAERGIDLDEFLESLVDGTGDFREAKKIWFEEMSGLRRMLADAKIPALVDLIETYEESGEPVVVFSAHRGPVDTLGRRPGWAVITGDTRSSDRHQIVTDFQAGRYKGIALTIKAGGVGITLTHAHQVIFADLEWTPALNSQAEDRVCRIGQDRGVIITHVVAAHKIDSRVSELLVKKQALISAAFEASAVKSVAAPVDVLAGVTVAAPEAAKPAPSVVDLSAIYQYLRDTGLRQAGFQVEGLCVRMAGEYSKLRGQAVVSSDKGYGGEYYGRITADGRFFPGRDCKAEVIERLKSYAANTDQIRHDAVRWGKKTGCCSFCGRGLTTAESVTVGYGPICAGKYGLPWGEVAESTTIVLQPS